VKTTPLAANDQREPKTAFYCVKCNKDLKQTAPARMVHLIAGGDTVLHPDDEKSYVGLGPHPDDLGWNYIGQDCAKKLGLEWTHPEPRYAINR